MDSESRISDPNIAHSEANAVQHVAENISNGKPLEKVHYNEAQEKVGAMQESVPELKKATEDLATAKIIFETALEGNAKLAAELRDQVLQLKSELTKKLGSMPGSTELFDIDHINEGVTGLVLGQLQAKYNLPPEVWGKLYAELTAKSKLDSLMRKDSTVQNESASKDGWLVIKGYLQPFRPEGVDGTALDAEEATIEKDRVKHFTTLMQYVLSKGYTLHPNTAPGHEKIFGVSAPYEAKCIVFPTHIMTPNPDENLAGKELSIREEIPILYLLQSFAHEATHLDRFEQIPGVASIMQQMIETHYLEPKVVNVISEGKITSETYNEEANTDVQAFFLLDQLGIKVSPENYCTYVGRGSLYEQIVYDRIREQRKPPQTSGSS